MNLARQLLLCSLLRASAVAPTVDQLGVGINLGNTLEATTEGAGTGGFWNSTLFDAYLAAGFKSVRVPVRWGTHMDATGTIDPVWLARVDEIVSYGVSIGLKVIVNTHGDRWIDLASEADFEALLPRFTSLWAQVAARFGTRFENSLIFEVFNEPHNMSTASLNRLNAAVVPVLRQASQTRGVMLGGGGWMSVWWLRGGGEDAFNWAPTNTTDPNLMLEIHDYSPMNVTTPSGAGFPVASWGSARQVAALRADMNWMGSFRARHPGLTVVLGEFACSRLQPNATARALWYATITRSAQQAGLAPILWDDNGWFRTLDRATMSWDDAVLHAVQLK